MARRLSRRAFLGGAAVAVGLPFLDAMRPLRSVRGAGSQVPKRLIGYYLPNGILMSAWTPTGVGSEFT
ncbi:MAG: twin-arginine translocation signal domain-containing protein, partial [Nannocystaceae bacterium]